MINQTYIDDKKVKDILTYISGMRHAEQIRMMFLCSLNGMRSINFCYLQVKDVYNPDLSVKDVICLDENKNKGKFGANYYLNSQMKKEFREYLKYLKSKNEELTPDDYIFKSQKLGKPYNRVSISRLFSNIYKKFNIYWASHFGRQQSQSAQEGSIIALQKTENTTYGEFLSRDNIMENTKKTENKLNFPRKRHLSR